MAQCLARNCPGVASDRREFGILNDTVLSYAGARFGVLQHRVASWLGIPDRGLLRNGFKADIVVFNPKTVRAPATRANPKQFPIGIEYVIVNGKVVVDGNVQNETLAGRALRRGRLTT